MKKQRSSLKNSGLPEEFPLIEELEESVSSSKEVACIILDGEIEVWQRLIVLILITALQE
jgi:hypothetical protein